MAYFEFCLEIVKGEGKRFNVVINTTTASQLTAATASDINFDNANNRCAFLYRCGSINLTFARDCFNKFFSEKLILFLLSDWIKSPDLTVCSISNGPALDYIALLLSCQERGINSSLFKNIKVISKYGAWRNSVNTMIEVVNEGHLSLPSLTSVSAEVIQGDPFTNLTEKVKDPLCNSDIVLMMKTLNLQTGKYDPNEIARRLRDFLVALKPGAILFCIDTKPSISLITHQLCTVFGSYLFEPTPMNTMINLDNADSYKAIFGCLPVLSARGSFLVWQKSSTIQTPNFEGLMEEVTESVKLLTCNVQEQNDKLLKNNEQVPSTDFGLLVPQMKTDTKHMIPNSSDQEPLGNVSNGTQSLKYSRPVPSPPKSNLSISAEDMESNNESSNASILVDQSIQTESENAKGTDSTKITELTSRIAKLTATVSEILETSEGDECGHSVLNNSTYNHHSPVASCPHNHSCAHFSEITRNCHTMCKCYQKKAFENYCHSHLCQENFISNQCSSRASFSGDFEASRNRNGNLCDNSLKFSAENNSGTTPKLVIPLNSLSENALAQILSIISQSSQD